MSGAVGATAPLFVLENRKEELGKVAGELLLWLSGKTGLETVCLGVPGWAYGAQKSISTQAESCSRPIKPFLKLKITHQRRAQKFVGQIVSGILAAIQMFIFMWVPDEYGELYVQNKFLFSLKS